jgi:hypothetical protein
VHTATNSGLRGTFQEIERSGYSGKNRDVLSRDGRGVPNTRGSANSSRTLAEARGALETWAKLGAELEAVAYNEAAPDHALLIQGEMILSTHA